MNHPMTPNDPPPPPDGITPVRDVVPTDVGLAGSVGPVGGAAFPDLSLQLPRTFGHAANSSAFAATVATFGFLLLTRCSVGVGEAAYGPVAPSVISDLFPVRRRGSILAWFYAAIPVGSALGYSLGGAAGWP